MQFLHDKMLICEIGPLPSLKIKLIFTDCTLISNTPGLARTRPTDSRIKRVAKQRTQNALIEGGITVLKKKTRRELRSIQRINIFDDFFFSTSLYHF